MRKLSIALAAGVALGSPKPAHPLAHWFDCRLNLRNHEIVERDCISYPINRAIRRPTGWWIKRIQVRPGLLRSVRYPRFHRIVKMIVPWPRNTYAVHNYNASLTVTGYSWGCGASQRMASGIWPFIGAGAATLPYGTRILVPGRGWIVVEDRGVPDGALDVFMSSCSEAIQWGRQQLEVTVSLS